ncbi:DUF3253 domain-containing protein [Roseivirga sp. BDSF3-8]|uniref:DUF3253 domain-containing protein n=1 Tax=Roseivirga sp. BDSF3-8 TaxID=3241598 RepID=UPI0035317F5F
MNTEKIRAAIRTMAVARGDDSTFCPSEVARALSPQDWRELMPAVRQEAFILEAEGKLQVWQKGKQVDPAQASGPIRLRKAP